MADRLRRPIRRLIIMIIILSLADAVFTAVGISLGVITEGNPLWQSAMRLNPVLASVAAFIFTIGLLGVIYKLSHRCRFTTALLSGVAAVKVVIVGMHLYWVSML